MREIIDDIWTDWFKISGRLWYSRHTFSTKQMIKIVYEEYLKL